MENVQYVELEQSTPTGRDIHFSSMLIDEIENENIDEVKWLLLHKNADPNLVLPNQGFSPMHVLAGLENECFSVEVIELALKERGGDPNIRSADGLTPVHLAAIWGRCTVLEILLKFGGDPFLLEYKFSLNAEDLALKEHQWQTHAILATFSVFNDQLDDYTHGSICRPTKPTSGHNINEWPNVSSKLTLASKNAVYKEYPSDCEDSISINMKSKDINSNISLFETECHLMDSTHLKPQSTSINCSYQESLNLYGNDGENSKEQDNKIQKRKKLSNQFTESFTKIKHFFGRASFPKISSGNSPKIDFKRKASKKSI